MRLTAEQIAEVVTLAAEGVSTNILASRFGCSDTRIRTIRKDAGVNVPTGRAARLQTRDVVCRICGKEFRTKRESRVVCGKRCAQRAAANGRQKLPARDVVRRELLMRLYWDEGRTSPEIAARLGMSHKSILGAMRLLGIPRRNVGTRRVAHCIESECTLPVYRIKHKTNGCMYGRRCFLHWVIHRMLVNQRYCDKTLKLGKDEAWLRRMRQLLARVRRLNREVSQSLKPESRPATTSPAACPLS
jgi:hypothetical protein